MGTPQVDKTWRGSRFFRCQDLASFYVCILKIHLSCVLYITMAVLSFMDLSFLLP